MQLRTATHPRIVWMMHSRAALWIRQSALFEMPHRRNLLARAQNLLAELESSLKVTDDLSRGLFYLYDYCYLLLETNDPRDHLLALRVMSILGDAFGILLKRLR
jgi:flagellin-specific chaperone FliS